MGQYKTVRQLGVSVIICCYNSSSRIEEVINYLSKQDRIDNIPIEILIINNASLDNTSSIVEEIIRKYRFFNIKYFYEEKPGLIHAREKGIYESMFEFLLFCDDDNFLSSNYVSEVFNIMIKDENIGACGGKGIELIRDIDKPEWFDSFKQSYAVGSQIRSPQLGLYGAGVCLRYSALQRIKNRGFVSFLTGRKGNELLAGDDSELILAIIISGFMIVASDEIFFFHLLPESRLNERYLKRMYVGFGMMYPVLNMYTFFIERNKLYRPYVFFILFYFNIILSFFSAIKKRGMNKRVYMALTLGKIKGIYFFRKDLAKIIRVIEQLSR
jgi:glycosyltransferase involved in cell wall biosynthesis